MKVEDKPDPEQGARDGARVAAALLSLVVLPIASASAGQPLSMRGIAWLAAGGIAVIGLAIGYRFGRWLAGLAILGWIATIVLTLTWPAPAPAFLHPVELPSGDPSSRAARLFSERDVSVVGARVMYGLGAVGEEELDGFVPALDAIYREIEASEGDLMSTPFASTVIGDQRAARFDAFVHEDAGSTERWVVFLHGYGGSFSSYCWAVALAAADAGVSTICPATSFSGRWQLDHGPGIVRATIDWIRARGARSIALVGLSNGGIGASRLARELANDLDALVLISGLDHRAAQPSMPTLVWHGARDTRFPIAPVRTWAEALPDGELIEVEGDHFALIEQRGHFASAFSAFLRRTLLASAPTP